jgi:hypothetical protein
MNIGTDAATMASQVGTRLRETALDGVMIFSLGGPPS